MTATEPALAYVRKAQLAKLLGLSPRTIDNWIVKRMIPVIATSPRLHLFDVEAVKGALEEALAEAWAIEI